MSRARVEQALKLVQPEQWKLFEEFVSAFLAGDLKELRVTASTGDRGRDAFVWRRDGDPTVLIQVSVAADWKSKIRETARLIRQGHPESQVLVYATNQHIAAAADEVRDEIRREHHLFLDVRDRGWFLDRYDSSDKALAASEKLAELTVDPLLQSEGLIRGKAAALETHEMQAAFVYLALQWEDDIREKGLTKLCFEALVRAVLRKTDSANRMTRAVVHASIKALLPGHEPKHAAEHIDSALKRLTKHQIRHWLQSDEFCLTYEEVVRIGDRLVQLTAIDDRLNEQIQQLIQSRAAILGISGIDEVQLTTDVRRVLETFLLERGEQFVQGVRTGRVNQMQTKDIEQICVRLAAQSDAKITANTAWLLVSIVETVFQSPSPELHKYLRSLADSYTLFAFLRETPDVQAAIGKAFSHGEIWLDTSAVLPLIAEQLAEPNLRRYTSLLGAAKEAGSRLLVTEGVLEEIDSHISISLIYAHGIDNRGNPLVWRGRIPFLFSMYALTGRDRFEFTKWTNNMRGRARPQQDIADFLEQNFGIKVQSLEADANRAPANLRVATQSFWAEAHRSRYRGA